MKFKGLQTKRHFVSGKMIVGIDPAKKKHQAAVLNSSGIAIGDSFTFKNCHEGYHEQLWHKLNKIGVKVKQREVVFAIEISCNLWQTLAHYLAGLGYKVVLVSPVTTRRSRPFINHDFSKTDPKDALLIASNAKAGYFDYFQDFSTHIRAMHQLSLTYDKLRKNLVQNKQRLRAQMELVFPEFLSVIGSDIDTARLLLKDYFLPQHYLELDVEKVAAEMEAVSLKQHGKATLNKIIAFAEISVGIPVCEELEIAIGLSIRAWITMIETVQAQMKQIMQQLITLARQTPYFNILVSLKGISDKLAAFFIAETRDLAQFEHYRKLEKFAGLNLKQTQSGNYVGRRHISHMGNHRLSWALYKMTEETAKYIPEVRMKYLRRQLKQPLYRKNVVASSTALIKLVVSLVKSNRVYEPNEDNLRALETLEHQYQQKRFTKKYRLAS